MRPILYSFRRCPYAMRTRLAVQSAGVECELREIVLRDKAPAFVSASPKATVPVLVVGETVWEESVDIMLWALEQNDPENWLVPDTDTLEQVVDLVKRADGDFKQNLDRYKYASRYDEDQSYAAREKAVEFLKELDEQLSNRPYLFGNHPGLADMGIAPFVRQFANVDRDWFDKQDWPCLRSWLEQFLASSRFANIMNKYPKWQEGDAVTIFPEGT